MCVYMCVCACVSMCVCACVKRPKIGSEIGLQLGSRILGHSGESRRFFLEVANLLCNTLCLSVRLSSVTILGKCDC